MKTFDAAIYYLVEKGDENAFDILLDEFLGHATGNELRKVFVTCGWVIDNF